MTIRARTFCASTTRIGGVVYVDQTNSYSTWANHVRCGAAALMPSTPRRGIEAAGRAGDMPFTGDDGACLMPCLCNGLAKAEEYSAWPSSTSHNVYYVNSFGELYDKLGMRHARQYDHSRKE